MEWLKEIFEILIIPILGVVSGFIVMYLQAKAKEIILKVENDTADKYIKMFADTVCMCVTTTNQTYVESLKAQGQFDAEAQKVAFEKTKNAVLAVLADDAKDYLTNMVGDFNAYLEQTIEATVNASK